MQWLECPDRGEWESRRKWFDELGESYAGEGSYLASEQACALVGEVETAFCAGAWVAVVVLAMAVVDAQLMETEVPGFAGNTSQLLDYLGANSDLHKLRKRRNALIHVDFDNPAITVDQQWANQSELNGEAKEAVALMFEAFYSNPAV